MEIKINHMEVKIVKEVKTMKRSKRSDGACGDVCLVHLPCDTDSASSPLHKGRAIEN